MKRPSIEVVVSDKKYLEAHIELFTKHYSAARAIHPELPVQYESTDVMKPFLSWMLNQCTGVTALLDGKPVGYMSALLIDPFKSAFKGAYTPEFAHASVLERRVEIYDAMRSKLWGILSSVECASHCISVLESDDALKNDHFISGYGVLVIDGIASTESLSHSTSQAYDQCSSQFRARIATTTDAEALEKIVAEHMQYMSRAPIFLFTEDEDLSTKLERWYMDEQKVTWVVECLESRELIGYANLVNDAENTCYVLRDRSIVGIQGTYISEAYRGKGVASTLLHEASHWAKNKGYTHISLDFESANHLAKHFWLKHFKVISNALIRHIDTRVLDIKISK